MLFWMGNEDEMLKLLTEVFPNMHTYPRGNVLRKGLGKLSDNRERGEKNADRAEAK